LKKQVTLPTKTIKCEDANINLMEKLQIEELNGNSVQITSGDDIANPEFAQYIGLT
jgi:hypothetical protein